MSVLRGALLVGLLAGMGLGMTACGTMRGAGQDIENAGEAVQDVAS